MNFESCLLAKKYILVETHKINLICYNEGEDWKNYAAITIYFEKQFTKIYIDKISIFNTALEVWLELRKNINCDLMNSSQQNIANMIGNSFEV